MKSLQLSQERRSAWQPGETEEKRVRCLGGGRDAEEGSDEDSEDGRERGHNSEHSTHTEGAHKTHRTRGGPGDTLFLRLVHTQSKTTMSIVVRNKP